LNEGETELQKRIAAATAEMNAVMPKVRTCGLGQNSFANESAGDGGERWRKLREGFVFGRRGFENFKRKMGLVEISADSLQAL